MSLRLWSTAGRQTECLCASKGRYAETTRDELNAWLGKQSGKPVHVATGDTDLTAELKRGLSFVRREKEPSASKELAGKSKKAKRK